MSGRAAAVLGTILVTVAFASTTLAGPERARTNWILNCQGCHRADARGTPDGAPNMAGEVARFLSVEGGRAFLVRVPGVANAPLPDDQLAELVNWLLKTFDGAHLPPGFTPYTAEEVGRLRAHALIEDAATMRARLIEAMNNKRFGNNEPGKSK